MKMRREGGKRLLLLLPDGLGVLACATAKGMSRHLWDQPNATRERVTFREGGHVHTIWGNIYSQGEGGGPLRRNMQTSVLGRKRRRRSCGVPPPPLLSMVVKEEQKKFPRPPPSLIAG